MEYERGIVVLANPYSEDASRKYNSVEVIFPVTGTVKFLCKLPHSLFMPGKIIINVIDYYCLLACSVFFTKNHFC